VSEEVSVLTLLPLLEVEVSVAAEEVSALFPMLLLSEGKV
jgi:hypothetical protein